MQFYAKCALLVLLVEFGTNAEKHVCDELQPSHSLAFLSDGRWATFVSPPALRDALAGEESLCFADVLFRTFLVISLRPIISTSTGPIFTKFAKVSRTLVVDEQSEVIFLIPLTCAQKLT